MNINPITVFFFLHTSVLSQFESIPDAFKLSWEETGDAKWLAEKKGMSPTILYRFLFVFMPKNWRQNEIETLSVKCRNIPVAKKY